LTETSEDGDYRAYGPIVFVMLTANVSFYSSTSRIPKFILDFESEDKDDNEFYKEYTFSHYNYNKPTGRIQYPKQAAGRSHLSRRLYKPKEIATFTVNAIPVVGKAQQVNITRMDVEYESDCSFDSLTFLKPATQNGSYYSLAQPGTDYSDNRWV
jgi:hypothetical protein